MANPENPGAIPPKVSPITPVQPGAPRPITVRLKPVARPVIPVASAAVPGDTANAIHPHQTSRIPLPDVAAHAVTTPAAAPQPVGSATIRLRPVTVPKAASVIMPGNAPSAVSPVSPVKASSPVTPVAATPLQPQRPPTPGANPLPPGPKPPSLAQVQAAKSKTSRISLDSAIGVAPVGEEPKTIRLKRPTDLPITAKAPSAAPQTTGSAFSQTTQLHQTSRISDTPDKQEKPAEEATVTQKKTLKIKRPGGASPVAPAAQKSETSAPVAEDVDFSNLKPVDFGESESKGSSVFLTISVIVGAAAAIVLILLTLCLGAQAMGPDAGKNSLASISGPELPWGSN